MALTVVTYIEALKSVLEVCLCLTDFPSEIVEKDNKPEVELQGYTDKTKPLVLNPIYIARSEKEKCLIEPSVNSCRISFKIKQSEELDILITDRFSRYLAVRADIFGILRRVPLDGYDVSFLITSSHLEKFDKQALIKWICAFIQDMEQDMNDIKLNIIVQTRIAAFYFINQLSNGGKK